MKPLGPRDRRRCRAMLVTAAAALVVGHLTLRLGAPMWQSQLAVGLMLITGYLTWCEEED